MVRVGRRASLRSCGALPFICCALSLAWASSAAAADIAPQLTGRYGGISKFVGSGLNLPTGVAVDPSGNVYIADTHNSEIEKVTPTGTLSVIAGTGTAGLPSAPGPAVSSDLRYPSGVAVDSSGNVYIADTENSEIEKVTPNGTLSVIAGTGTAGAATATPGTAAIDSELNYPQGVAVDSSGNVYIADTDNGEIEKVTPTGTLSIIAGGNSGNAIGGPSGVAVDSSGNVYIADAGGDRVEKISQSTGNLSVIAGRSSSYPIGTPAGVAVDSSGNVYVTDETNNEIDKFSQSTSDAAVIVGNTSSYSVRNVTGVAVDSSGNVYFTDAISNTVGELTDESSPTVTGTPLQGNQLTASPGTWDNSPTGYSYEWQRCNTDSVCSDITANANDSTYMLTSADVGSTIRVQVTATNSGGSTMAASSRTLAVTGQAPVESVSPSTAGTPEQGQRLTASNGSWTNDPTGYSYRWQRCDVSGASCTDIAGATQQSYTPTVSDVGHTIIVWVTATNSVGSTTASSAPSGVIAAQPTPTSKCLTPTGTLSGTGMGQLKLGMTQTQAQKLGTYTRTTPSMETFCAKGGSVQATYPTNALLRHVNAKLRAQIKGRVIIALTTNARYQINGVKAGSSVKTAARRLQLGKAIKVGANTWYVITTKHATWLIKAHNGKVTTIGVTLRALTQTHAQQQYLLTHS